MFRCLQLPLRRSHPAVTRLYAFDSKHFHRDPFLTMAPPTYTASGLGFDMSGVDAMELQSDNGALDITDGDIELDFEHSPSHGQDDDVTLDDAASATGEMQDEHAYDDFMVDQEDVIEEDEDDGGDGSADIELPAVEEATTVTPTQLNTAIDDDDDDLIDYTEDEEYHKLENRSPSFITHLWGQFKDTPVKHSIEQKDETTVKWQAQDGQAKNTPEQQEDETTVKWQAQEDWTQAQDGQAKHTPEQQEKVSADWQQDWTETQDGQTADPNDQEDWTQNQEGWMQNSEEQQDEIPADLRAMMSNSNKSQSPYLYNQGLDDQNSKEQEADQYEYEEYTQGDGGHDGVSSQGQEEPADGETAHEEPAHEKHYHHDSAENHDSQSHELSELPSVTINYKGIELWLFKQYDFDNSGDWLLGDIALAKASISDLIHACRSALGNAVLNEMELGFQFEDFENMQLFEDNTACVAVSLERLVTYYHLLHASDGNNEPGSFYVKLVYRPRFATLLSDIAKFADQGLGFTAFDAAVAAGETHFDVGIAGAPSEEPAEWEKEDKQKGDGEEQEQAQEHAQSEFQSGNHHSEQNQDEGDGTQGAYEDDIEVYETDDASAYPASQEEHAQSGVQSDAYHNEQNYGEGEDTQGAYEDDGIEVYDTEEAPAPSMSHEEHASNHDEDDGIEVYDTEEAPAPFMSHEEHASNHDEDDGIEVYDTEEAPAPSVSHEEQTQGEVESDAYHSEQNHGEGEGTQGAYEDDSIEVYATEEAPAPSVSHEEHASNHDEDPEPEITISADIPTDLSPTVAQLERERSRSAAATEAELEARRLKDEADYFIDYSDEEDEEPETVKRVEQALATEPSPSSATVQGDETANAGVQESAADPEQTGPGTVEEPDAETEHGEPEGDKIDEASYDTYPEFDIYAGDDAGDTNQDYVDYGQTDSLEEITDTAWAAYYESVQYDEESATIPHDNAGTVDEEDGVAEETGSASATDPQTASSNDVNDESPQGLKRRVDEAGHGADAATNSPDPKRPRV
ncbi:conserved glutamic acid-rich [Pyrenophora seminiperda CCB06]|uniref:Conserved glutamic acid-rich n=1 Tax=Pyrenophora seminiperda CCB06 TaxID=1302712 RepID=A0A3M7MF73_9PLEO|nr:conserved glutamic acid-rich [Pyrenophora seminiperda CCB06]